ncbi:Flavohemoprotein [Methyloligella halotolerans]|uniref:Flavohemoprotein n=1 Tax=Methyloligella halotolerans TaxID=1177755 RepID=A0A1E2S0S4_9HYPH|nr:NO-inducible flavohemoprotein [Methyloligella halotolerans]ODA68087.1 Flavohemoprotein [Methyloligella halotolerans]
MLSAETISIVKSTVPVLEEHGETLTRHFYKRMFSHNPEVKPFFNQAHQRAGLQQQALAGAICAYAANIDNLGALGPAVELIAQKHVALQVRAEHYPIVGENLLASIKEVLGDGATDEVIQAWAEAYGVLVDVLVGRESAIYDEIASEPGGWSGFKQFRIARKEPESDVITSFYLEPVDGKRLPEFKPGQYITLRVPTPDGSTTMRNYSLSDRPGQGWFRISVKREESKGPDAPEGYVSTLLHRELEPGDEIEVAAPCGEFFLQPDLDPDRPLVLLAGGVGITPLFSILSDALQTSPERPILLVHGAVNEDMQAFREVIDQLAEKHPNLHRHYCYDEPAKDGATRAAHMTTGLVDEALLDKLLPGEGAEYYFCGPKPFMESVHRQLTVRGVPAENLHFEFFGPRGTLD